MKRFKISQEQLDKLLEASQPVPFIIFGGHPPRSPQENANSAWDALGKELGFDYMTVRPVAGQPDTVFEAEEVA